MKKIILVAILIATAITGIDATAREATVMDEIIASQQMQEWAEFRKNLNEGVKTNCGYVVEAYPSRDTVVVQTPRGEREIKRERLFPPGDADCRL